VRALKPDQLFDAADRLAHGQAIDGQAEQLDPR
jgi:hypothetical protein